LGVRVIPHIIYNLSLQAKAQAYKFTLS